MTTATSHDALAWEDARAALSRCESVQTWLAVSGADATAKAAAAAALIFLKDAGDTLPERYLLVTVSPQKPVNVADGAKQRVYDITVECSTKPEEDDTDPQDDFVKGHNLGEVSVDLWDQHEDGLLDFEMVEIPVCGDPFRADDLSDRAGDILQLITFQLESWGE